MDGLIVVTGATGWVGLSAIDELQQMLDLKELIVVLKQLQVVNHDYPSETALLYQFSH